MKCGKIFTSIVFALIFLGESVFHPTSVQSQSSSEKFPSINILGVIKSDLVSQITASFFYLGNAANISREPLSTIVFFVGPDAVVDSRISKNYLSGFTNDQKKLLKSYSVSKDGCNFLVVSQSPKEFLIVADTNFVQDNDLVRCTIVAYARAVGLPKQDMQRLTNQELISFIFSEV